MDFKHIYNAETKVSITRVVESAGMPVRYYVHQGNLEEYPMIEDPIVEAVRRYRYEHAAQYDNVLKLIVEALREKERTSKQVPSSPGHKALLRPVGS